MYTALSYVLKVEKAGDQLVVFINDQEVRRVNAENTPAIVDLTARMRTGTNRIRLNGISFTAGAAAEFRGALEQNGVQGETFQYSQDSAAAGIVFVQSMEVVVKSPLAWFPFMNPMRFWSICPYPARLLGAPLKDRACL